jgi:hypothetical protein
LIIYAYAYATTTPNQGSGQQGSPVTMEVQAV